MSQKKKNPVATVCSLLGTILLIVLILGCIPLTVPKAFGYNIYTVISGSMEPTIPVGSLVYVKYQEPETIQKKDVIAFYGAKDASSIVTHRVVTNKKLSGEFITKGDANQTKDMNPVNYNNYMGKVVLSIPGRRWSVSGNPVRQKRLAKVILRFPIWKHCFRLPESFRQ